MLSGAHDVITCSRCGEEKPETGFYKSKTPKGRDSWCISCRLAYHKARRLRLRDSDSWKRQQRARDLKRRYGISEEQYEALYTAQQGRCAVCGDSFERLFVDHNHETEQVRGLLCNPCNGGVGAFKDSPERLVAAAAYLVLTDKVLMVKGQGSSCLYNSIERLRSN